MGSRLGDRESRSAELTDISLIANEQVVILVTDQGYIKRMPVATFEAQSRATRGKAGAKMKEDDGVQHFITCYTHDYLLFFSDRGVTYALRAYQIAEGSRASRGMPSRWPQASWKITPPNLLAMITG
ncbi:DNA gyrase C-terminal beta-propeller domain-containing protein [Leptolyngbya sp. KIOST-1]|uniref:DNA gyrase C-terminal beta-propeller domain-containing protein n=1 Tax=Leptolyngbya sp. KIOST-1 TaxID=1229172 RepID=UPI00298DF339|nr:DNA gyrase C-terminal beta-propeller domain-containing protein [Leptolyngbya sp. KIOST-1]